MPITQFLCRRRRIVLPIGLLIAAGLAVASVSFLHRTYWPETFRLIKDNQRTQVVPTLDTPIEVGTNAVWCASFPAAWKRLQNNLAGGSVVLDGAEELCRQLDAAPDPKMDVPDGSLYAAAGRGSNGIVDKIASDVSAQFPNSPPPDLGPVGPLDVVAYARLEASVKFPIPYFDNDEALQFTDATGKKLGLKAFGIRDADELKYTKLRAQPRILHCAYKQYEYEAMELIVDLDAKSDPVQVIVAMVPRSETLSKLLDTVEQRIARGEGVEDASRDLGSSAGLLVPEMAWRLKHAFAELEGRRITAGPLSGATLSAARQEIAFRLDRSGGELRSEATMIYSIGMPRGYHINRPFAVIMKKRDAERPFFVAWIENDELLEPFPTPK